MRLELPKKEAGVKEEEEQGMNNVRINFDPDLGMWEGCTYMYGYSTSCILIHLYSSMFHLNMAWLLNSPFRG